MGQIRAWKKVFENDLTNIICELKDAISQPATIILTGPLGSGKTTFTKYFVGEGEQIVSPTYSLVNEKANIAHADLYRLEDVEELVHLELPLYLENKDFFLVEWGQKYISTLKKEVNEEFKFYELEISINNSASKEFDASRNYLLKEVN